MANPKGNPATLTAPRFQPGRSGNPSGRPRKKATDKLEARLDTPIRGDKNGRTYLDLLVEKMVRRACNGSDAMAKEIFDRLEGKPMQRTEVSGPGGSAIPLTLEEVDARLRELVERARVRAAASKTVPILVPDNGVATEGRA